MENKNPNRRRRPRKTQGKVKPMYERINDETEGWKVHKAEQKDRRAKRVAERKQIIKDTASVLGLVHRVLTPYQIRLSGQGKMVDLYLTHGRYHDIVNNKRGEIGRDFKQFIINFFK